MIPLMRNKVCSENRNMVLDVLARTFLFSTLAAMSVAAFAQTQIQAVRLSDVEGTVQVFHGDQPEFEQAFQNMPVLEGSRLQTGEDGRAEVQFEDGGIARLTPNSSLSLNQLGRASSGSTVNQLEAISGLIYIEAGAGHSQQYSILVGGDVIALNDAGTLRVSRDSGAPELAVLQGSVQISNPDQPGSVTVHDGETVHFGDQARYDMTAGIVPDTWDQWNLDRDQALASMASQQTSGVSAGDTGGTGWSDLDAYGDWYSAPGYGNVWAPNDVDASWDPYGSGYWGYYPGYGYIWISANPWGWLPYRCGTWNYFDSFGWGWLPNNCGSGWFTDVGIWEVPPYYTRPRRPLPPPKGRIIAHQPIIPIRRAPNPVAKGRIAPPIGDTTGRQTAHRSLQIAGRTVAPLPKTIVPVRAGWSGPNEGATDRYHPQYLTSDPARRLTAAPPQPIQTLETADPRRPVYPPGANRSVSSGRSSYPGGGSGREAGNGSSSTPGIYTPRPSSPGYRGPGDAGPGYRPVNPGPRYEPRTYSPPPAPRASAPAPAPGPRASAPAPSPAPAPAAPKK